MSPHTTLNGDADHNTSPPTGTFDKHREAESGLGENETKTGYGPGPADPYVHHKADGTPIVAVDELRIAGMCSPSAALWPGAWPVIWEEGMPADITGVKRIEAISAQLGPKARALMFFGCFLVAYAYGLDGVCCVSPLDSQLPLSRCMAAACSGSALYPRSLCEYRTDTAQANRYSFQSFATSEFEVNSLITTISVVRSVIGAAAQPAGGKIADVFGRLELLVVSIIFYVVGSIIEAASTNLSGFSAGAVFYELGYTMAQLLSTSLRPLSLPVAGLPPSPRKPPSFSGAAGNSWMLCPGCTDSTVEVIIADLSSLRTRVFFSFVPAMPFLINSWISPFVLQAALGKNYEKPWFWRWGIGMWAIIYPGTSIIFPLHLR